MTILLCFPHAGGSAAGYYQWKRYLNENIEVNPVELPGRGTKIKMAPHRSMDELIDSIFDEVHTHIATGRNYTVFGHSFGSWVAYELYSRISGAGLKEPSALFFSGLRPPYADNSAGLPESESDEDILKILQYFGGTDETILQNDELRPYYMSALKADFRVIRDYRGTKHKTPVECPAILLSGKDDHTVSNADLFAWKEVCTDFTLKKIPGAHFYPFSNARETVEFINLYHERLNG